MSEFYDDSKLRAPQYNTDSQDDTFMQQSAYNDYTKRVLSIIGAVGFPNGVIAYLALNGLWGP